MAVDYDTCDEAFGRLYAGHVRDLAIDLALRELPRHSGLSDDAASALIADLTVGALIARVDARLLELDWRPTADCTAPLPAATAGARLLDLYWSPEQGATDWRGAFAKKPVVPISQTVRAQLHPDPAPALSPSVSSGETDAAWADFGRCLCEEVREYTDADLGWAKRDHPGWSPAQQIACVVDGAIFGFLTRTYAEQILLRIPLPGGQVADSTEIAGLELGLYATASTFEPGWRQLYSRYPLPAEELLD